MASYIPPAAMSTSELNARFVACRACDALWPRPELPAGHKIHCPRCDCVIQKHTIQQPQRCLALLLSSVVLMALVAFFPFLEMHASGLGNQISVAEAVGVLWSSGFTLLSLGVALLVFVFPLCRVIFSSVIAWRALSQRPMGKSMRRLMAMNQSMAPWAMAEIFMLGVVVTMVKVSMLAQVQLGGAFWALAAFLVAMGAGFAAMSTDVLWSNSRANV